ncbi:MAG: DUF5134 domain-containing protein [Actinomycetota bacterium]|nr:DUF5134 domain-containing protein [Actinomycetota bacterium]
MNGPAWLIDGLAVLMVATAPYCAGRLVASRLRPARTEFDVDLMHLVMGLAMAGMLLVALDYRWNLALGVAFAAWLGWFAVHGIRAVADRRARRWAVGDHPQHLLASGAMVYMLVGMPAPAAATDRSMAGMHDMAGMHNVAGMSGSGASSHPPLLALVLAGALLCYAVRNVGQIAVGRRAPGEKTPRLTLSCQLAMAATMGYLLLTA